MGMPKTVTDAALAIQRISEELARDSEYTTTRQNFHFLDGTRVTLTTRTPRRVNIGGY